MLWLLAPLLTGSLDLVAPVMDRFAGQEAQRWMDAGFRILEPDAYEQVADALSPEDDERLLGQLLTRTRELVEASGIQARIEGRTKSMFSTHRKMRRKHLAPHEVYDRVALRLLVDREEDCYDLLEAIHQDFEPLSSKDYIATPKDNGYQSLHTVVRVGEAVAEFQLRTHAMHAWAETGGAAHWRYKAAS